MREWYPVIIIPAKGDGFCPEFVLKNETDKVECNTLPCSEHPFHTCSFNVKFYYWFLDNNDIMCT